MKHALSILLASCLLTSIASADPIVPKPGSLTPAPVLTVPPIRGPLPTLILACPDPAATSIDFAVTQTSRWAGQAMISGTVKNAGSQPYVSRQGQQIVELWEMVPGIAPRLVDQRPFVNLAPGEAVTVHYSRPWNASSPAEGEFPPSYRLIVTYDPDIRLDGNPRNDDCNTADNVITRSGSAISALFH